jgi:cytoskeletal protein CcmA (bactofilin family)
MKFNFKKYKKFMMIKNGKFKKYSFPSNNIIGHSTRLYGEINSEGNFRIDGVFKGILNIEGDLVVGHQGIVSGEINAKNLESFGVIDAKINIQETAILRSSSNLRGDLNVHKLVVEEDSVFNGTCSFHSNEDDIDMLNVALNDEYVK